MFQSHFFVNFGDPQLILLLTVAGATLGTFIVAYRMWRLEEAVEKARARVDLVPRVVKEARSSADPVTLQVTNVSAAPALIEGVAIVLDPDDGSDPTCLQHGQRFVVVAPYATLRLRLGGILGPACRELARQGHSLVGLQVMLSFIASGKRFSTPTINYTLKIAGDRPEIIDNSESTPTTWPYASEPVEVLH